MKKISPFYAVCILLSTILVFASCNSDAEEESDIRSQNAKSISGIWICYEQTTSSLGKMTQKTYTGNEYYIEFNDNHTGSIHCGRDGLLGIGSVRLFSYTVSEDKVITDADGENIFTIVSLTNDNLILKWGEEGYSITCKFKKYISDEGKSSMSRQTLIGHWVCLACTTEYGNERTWDINDLQLATGDYLAWTVDFYENGSGYVDTGVGSNVFLGSTYRAFNWSLSTNKIEIRVNGIEEEGWKIESYTNGILKLSAVGGSYKATLKKGV